MNTRSFLLPLRLSEYASTLQAASPQHGWISEDQSAITGKDSWLYLFKGSNSYYDGYLTPDHDDLSHQWLDIIEKREKICSKMGALFRQVIVPNKASILSEYYPHSLPRMQTDILKRILDKKSDLIICPIQQWRDTQIKLAVFRRNDSHLTMAGNAHLTGLILSSLGLPQKSACHVQTSLVEHVGDLGVKYDPGFSEFFHAPSFESGLLDQQRIIKTFEYIPETGFTGTTQTFYNAKPIYDHRVVVFGNSFYEKSPSWGMTPIFAALFKSIHFVWSSRIETEIVETIAPDIVIAQTCERFLCRVPDS